MEKVYEKLHKFLIRPLQQQRNF